MTKKVALSQDRIDQLKFWMPKGSTVYTVLRSVSGSGMSRVIDVVVFDGKFSIHPKNIVSDLLGLTVKDTGLVVRGCGMDMGFWLVYEISYALYGNGYALTNEWL